MGSAGTSPCPGCGEAGLALVAVPWASRPKRASGSLLPHCGAGPTAWLLAGSPAYSRSARGQTWGPEPLWDDKWGRLLRPSRKETGEGFALLLQVPSLENGCGLQLVSSHSWLGGLPGPLDAALWAGVGQASGVPAWASRACQGSRQAPEEAADLPGGVWGGARLCCDPAAASLPAEDKGTGQQSRAVSSVFPGNQMGSLPCL